jgi:ornithine carbamoyltransferase
MMVSRFHGRDYLQVADYTPEEIGYVVDTAIDLKRRRAMGELYQPLRGKTVAVLFEKQSTRTRVSFQAGAAQLGADSFYLRPDELQVSRGEPIKDTARIIDRYCDALVMRTWGHDIIEEYAKWMRNPVINAMDDLVHPCQALCDVMTIKEKKGRYAGLKLCYLGDFRNVNNSLMMAAAMLGMDFAAASPQGYEPDPGQLKAARGWAARSGSTITYTHELEEAVEGADIVYGNTWHSMGTDSEKERRIKEWAPYQVNGRVMQMAKPTAVFMHCLPGYRGEDMTDDVVEGPQSVVWDQGENRMHTEKAIMALTMG